MSPEMHEALLHSITHWMELAKPTMDDWHSSSCALCEATKKDNDGIINCTKCPIYEKTGSMYCKSTPWKKYNGYRAWLECSEYHVRLESEDTRDIEVKHNLTTLALAEANFLRSLLPGANNGT